MIVTIFKTKSSALFLQNKEHILVMKYNDKVHDWMMEHILAMHNMSTSDDTKLKLLKKIMRCQKVMTEMTLQKICMFFPKPQ